MSGRTARRRVLNQRQFRISYSGNARSSGFSPGLNLPKPNQSGLVFAHIIHIGLGRDLLFESRGPVGGIDQQPAQALVLEVHRRAHRGGDTLSRSCRSRPV